MGGLLHFSVSPRPLGFGFGTNGFGAEGLGPGLDKIREFSLRGGDRENSQFFFFFNPSL